MSPDVSIVSDEVNELFLIHVETEKMDYKWAYSQQVMKSRQLD